MTSNNTSVIVPAMATQKRVDVDSEEVLAQHKASDPEFARWWDHNTAAREVAGELIGYRYHHNLTQAELATLVGVKQPQIARWENGESLPSSANLARLAGKLRLEFVISYAPTDRRPKHVTKSALDAAQSYEQHGATVRITASGQR